jgi:hypothetical protein
VSAELEPAAELAVVGEERLAVIGRDDPGRAGDVTLAAAPQQAVRVRAHEVAHLRDDGRVLGALRQVAHEQVEEAPAVHGAGSLAEAWPRRRG